MHKYEKADPEIAIEDPDRPDVVIGRGDLTIADVLDVSYSAKFVRFPRATNFIEQLDRSVSLVNRVVEKGIPVYGVNTNFGGMADNTLPLDRLSFLQQNLLWGLKCSVGRELPLPCVRAAMLIRANALCRGASGIRLEVLSRFLSFLNNGVTPLLSDLGSIGASGDLVPLSYIAGALIGLDRSFCVSYRG